MDLRAPRAPQFMSPDIGNSLSEPRAERRPLSRNMFTRRPTKKYFFPNSWSCLQDYCVAGRRRKPPLDGATDFLSTIWQHITTVSFVSAFIFVLPRKPEKASKRLWIGLVSNHCMLEKDCNGNPISTCPPCYERIQHLTSSILPAKSESLHQCEMDNKVER